MNHFRPPTTGIELVDHRSDDHLIGHGGVSDDGVIHFISLQPRVEIEVAQVFQSLDQRFGLDRL